MGHGVLIYMTKEEGGGFMILKILCQCTLLITWHTLSPNNYSLRENHLLHNSRILFKNSLKNLYPVTQFEINVINLMDFGYLTWKVLCYPGYTL